MERYKDIDVLITKVEGFSLSSPYGSGDSFGQPKGVKSIGLVQIHTNVGVSGLGETYAGVYSPSLINPIVEFLKEQANESLMHAQQAGELLTGLDGHPSQKIASIVETNDHSIQGILEESLAHEVHALNLYKELLTVVEGKSVYLEEYTRDLIGQEEQHQLELKKMLKDFS